MYQVDCKGYVWSERQHQEHRWLLFHVWYFWWTREFPVVWKRGMFANKSTLSQTQKRGKPQRDGRFERLFPGLKKRNMKVNSYYCKMKYTKVLKGHGDFQKKSHKEIVISDCAIRSHGLVIRSHGLVIRSLELDNSVSRIAIRSLELDNSFSRIAFRSLGLDNSFSRITIRSLELDNPFSRVASRSLELHISIREYKSIFKQTCFLTSRFKRSLIFSKDILRSIILFLFW